MLTYIFLILLTQSIVQSFVLFYVIRLWHRTLVPITLPDNLTIKDPEKSEAPKPHCKPQVVKLIGKDGKVRHEITFHDGLTRDTYDYWGRTWGNPTTYTDGSVTMREL